MLSVFKLVSCKAGASKELALRPSQAKKLHSTCSKLVFGLNVTVV